MKVLIAQINLTPRDFTGNLAQIRKGIHQGIKAAVDLIVFPELAIPGYLCKDLVYDDKFVEQNLHCLQQVVKTSDSKLFGIAEQQKFYTGVNPHIVVGYIDRNRKGYGKPVRNMAAVIRNGVIEATYQKQLLPFYDVFDEGRYFEPGNELTVINIVGRKWGICICEDVWNDKDQDDYNYENNPLARYRDIGVKNIISINSSPYVHGKQPKRRKMMEQSADEGIGIYVNQIGGQDELIFDGHSIIVDRGTTVFQAETSLDPTYTVFETAKTGDYGIPWDRTKYAQADSLSTLRKMLVMGLRDYVRKSGFSEVVLGSSGGIDSAVTAALACEALGPENVHAIRMPGPYSSKGSVDDASRLHDNLGCWDYLVPIDIKFDIKNFDLAIQRHKDEKNLVYRRFATNECNSVAEENLQARKRGEIVMRFSNKFGALALTTGNKSELAVGYTTLYGDACGGFAPINDLFKTQVYKLAMEINRNRTDIDLIPKAIIEKAPSAELAPNQTDEASLLPYLILDNILEAYINGHIGDFDQFVVYAGEKLAYWTNKEESKKEYARIIRLVDDSEFKRRQAAPGLKVTSVAFGTGRRLPIVKGKR